MSNNIIDSMATIEQLLNSWEKKFFNSGKGYPSIWYRGHANEAWPLLPGSLRKSFLDSVEDEQDSFYPPEQRGIIRERTINKQFRTLGAQYLPTNASLVEIYILAQHHGLPTRFLDWTTNLLTALFFAVNSQENNDGAIYVVNPRDFIPNVTDSKYPPDIVHTSHKIVVETVSTLFGESDRPKLPFIVPVAPDQTAGRVCQQSSRFTLYMPDADISRKAKSLEKYIVPKEAKSTFLLQLRRLNINWATIMCDLDSVALELKTGWQLK